jgi:hypothetical protein
MGLRLAASAVCLRRPAYHSRHWPGGLGRMASGDSGSAAGGALIGGAAGGLVGALSHAGVREDDTHVCRGVRLAGIIAVAAKC